MQAIGIVIYSGSEGLPASESQSSVLVAKVCLHASESTSLTQLEVLQVQVDSDRHGHGHCPARPRFCSPALAQHNLTQFRGRGVSLPLRLPGPCRQHSRASVPADSLSESHGGIANFKFRDQLSPGRVTGRDCHYAAARGPCGPARARAHGAGQPPAASPSANHAGSTRRRRSESCRD